MSQSDKSATKTNSERQAKFKAKMRADGFYQRTVWFHKESETQGYQHGLEGNFNVHPALRGSVDAMSFLAGWDRGLDDYAAMKAVENILVSNEQAISTK